MTAAAARGAHLVIWGRLGQAGEDRLVAHCELISPGLPAEPPGAEPRRAVVPVHGLESLSVRLEDPTELGRSCGWHSA